MAPILASITDAKQLETFKQNSKLPDSSGFKSLEKTTISTMMESFKPMIDLALAALELLSAAEIFVGKAFTGVNPYAVADSFSAGKASATQQMAALSAASLASPSSRTATAELPDQVLFGAYDLVGNSIQPTVAEQAGLIYFGNWPLVHSLAAYTDARLAEIAPALGTMSAPDRNDMEQSTRDCAAQAWADITQNGPLFTWRMDQTPLPPLEMPPALKAHLPSRKVQIGGLYVEIAPEDDYDVVVIRDAVAGRIYLRGNVKPAAKIAAQGAAAAVPPAPDTSPYVPNPVKAPILLVKLVVPAITKKLVPAITALQTLLSDPANFLLQIAMTKLGEHIEFFDPAIKSLPDTDPKRQQYYSGNTFLLDGVASISLGGFNLTLGIKDGLPFGNTNPPDPDAKDQPMLKAIINMIKMPIEFIKGVVKAFLDLMKKLANPANVAQAITDFITFQWVLDLLKPDNVIVFLGAQPGQPDTIPFFQGASFTADQVTDIIKQMLKMVQEMINAFISMPCDIFNLPQGIRDAMPKVKLVE